MKVDYSGMAEGLKNDLKKAIEQNKEALKTCPFCGGEAVTIESYNYKANKFLPAVMCLECKSRTTTFLNVNCAIEAWNNRKPLERVIERLEKEKSNLTTWAEDEAYKLAINKAIEIIKEEVG